MRSGDSTILSGLESTPRSILSSTRGESTLRSTGKDTQHYVGFANFPNQVYRRAIKHGFDFTLMVVGQSGLGKSTFINTLFLAEINDSKKVRIPKTNSTVSIEQTHVLLKENGTTLRLTLIDTPGFGDAVDNSKCADAIVQFVESRYLDYFCEETKIERKEKVPDKCVHLCLYFISPVGKGLKAVDIDFMKKLHEHVNIVPIIAMSDLKTKDELAEFKLQVLKDIEINGLKIYKFPEPEDEEERKQQEPMRKKAPFAVVGSNNVKAEGGKKIRIREYPWGTVEVESHSDFFALRDMIIRTNIIDMIDVTRNVHYENFRFRQMQGKAASGSIRASIVGGQRDPFTSMEDDRKRKEREFTQKQKEMDGLFEEKVRDRNSQLADRERRLNAREVELRRMIEERKADLERLRQEMDAPSVKVSRTNSKVSLSNENGLKTSPNGEKTKTKKSGLGLFTRN